MVDKRDDTLNISSVTEEIQEIIPISPGDILGGRESDETIPDVMPATSNQKSSTDEKISSEPGISQTSVVDQKPRSDERYDNRSSGKKDRDRPLTNEEKLRNYKRQSDERLLDIKRSREAKVGKKRK